MLLTVTNSRDATADYLLPILATSGLKHVRLDTDRLISSITLRYADALAEIIIDGNIVSMGSISHVWYRRPERLRDAELESSPEGRYALSEWTEALDALLGHIPIEHWMNHPTSNSVASQKLLQLSVAAKLGFIVPDTLVTQNATEAKAFILRHRFGVVAKPMASAYVARESAADSLIYTNLLNDDSLLHIDDVSHCPTLFQEYINKDADIRITVVDNVVTTCELYAADAGIQRCDIRRNNMNDVQYREVALPSGVETLIHKLMVYFRLRFAAIDMVRRVDGELVFLEVNPNGQWAWLDQCANMRLWESFVKSFSSN